MCNTDVLVHNNMEVVHVLAPRNLVNPRLSMHLINILYIVIVDMYETLLQ